jgi:hypothetical protein
MNSEPDKITLLKTADKSLKILTKSEWNDFDYKVWKSYEEIDELVKYPYAECIGRYNDLTVLYGRVVTDSEESFEDYGSSFKDEIDDTIIINTCVFKFKEGDEYAYIDDLLFGYENILCGDGRYNILKDVLPEKYVDLIIENSLSEYSDVEDDIVPASRDKVIRLLLKNEVSVDKIKDPNVMIYINKILSNT